MSAIQATYIKDIDSFDTFTGFKLEIPGITPCQYELDLVHPKIYIN